MLYIAAVFRFVLELFKGGCFMLTRTLKTGLLMAFLMTVFCGCGIKESQIATEVKEDIVKSFRNDSDLKDVRINSLTVKHRSGDKYDGRLEVSAGGRTLTVEVDITYEEKFLYNEFTWEISAGEMQRIGDALYEESW